MPLERINLTGMYQPNRNIYLQVVKATGGTQLHLAGTVQFDEEQNVVCISEMKAPVVKIQENIKVSLIKFRPFLFPEKRNHFFLYQ